MRAEARIAWALHHGADCIGQCPCRGACSFRRCLWRTKSFFKAQVCVPLLATASRSDLEGCRPVSWEPFCSCAAVSTAKIGSLGKAVGAAEPHCKARATCTMCCDLCMQSKASCYSGYSRCLLSATSLVDSVFRKGRHAHIVRIQVWPKLENDALLDPVVLLYEAPLRTCLAKVRG